MRGNARRLRTGDRGRQAVDVRKHGLCEQGGRSDDGSERRVERLRVRLGRRLCIASLREERLDQADAGDAVRRLALEGGAKPRFCVRREAGLVEGGADEEHRARPIGRNERRYLVRCRAAGQHRGRERQERRGVIGVLRERLAPGLLGRAPVASAALDLCEQAEREVRTLARGGDVLGRRVADLEAAAGKPLGLREVARLPRAERQLVDEVGVVGEDGEPLREHGTRALEVAVDTAYGSEPGDEDRSVSDLLPAAAELRPRGLELLPRLKYVNAVGASETSRSSSSMLRLDFSRSRTRAFR